MIKIKRIWREIKWAVIIILWVTSLLLGFWGFSRFGIDNNLSLPILERAYRTLQLISMNSGAVDGQANWMLNIARFLVPLLAAYTVLQAITNIFREQTQWLRLWRLRNHVIVCGLGRKGRFLIDDLLKNGLHLVTIEKNLEPVSAEEYRRKGVIVIEGDAADPDTLDSARLQRASHLVCLLGNDKQNLSIAFQAYQQVKRIQRKPLTCIIHLISDDLNILVKNRELESDTKIPFNLEIFNTYQRTAQTLVNHVTDQHPQPNRLLIVGMGRLGANIITQSAYRAYTHEPLEHLSITVIDRVAEINVKKMVAEFPHISDVCDIKPIQLELTSNQALRKTAALLPEFDRVYICLGNTILGIQTSLTLMEIPNLANTPFFIRLEHHTGLFNLLEESLVGQHCRELIVPFDMYEQTCTADLIFGGLHELLAIKLRDNFIKSLDPEIAGRLGDIPWKFLPEAEKESNRQQASRIYQVLHYAGYSISTLSNWDARELTFDKDEVQRMASFEHDLWCKWKHEEGWQYGIPRDDQQKIHPDLVPWNKLDKAEQDKNIKTIIGLPALLAELGFQIDKFS